jgi:hypothetical protein
MGYSNMLYAGQGRATGTGSTVAEHFVEGRRRSPEQMGLQSKWRAIRAMWESPAARVGPSSGSLSTGRVRVTVNRSGPGFSQ